MLSAGRSPWMWKKNQHWRFDTFLSIASLFWTVGATIFTMIRCRQRWEFVVLAFWKMMMSLTLSAIATHAAVIVRRKLAAGHFSKNNDSESMEEQDFTAHPTSDHSKGIEPLLGQPRQGRRTTSDIPSSEVEIEGNGTTNRRRLPPKKYQQVKFGVGPHSTQSAFSWDTPVFSRSSVSRGTSTQCGT
jgi:hypothetical protein